MGVVCRVRASSVGFRSLFCPLVGGEKLQNIYPKLRGGKSISTCFCCFAVYSKVFGNTLWKFTSSLPLLCDTDLRPRGMTLLNKLQLVAFSQQNTNGVCSMGGSQRDGVQREKTPTCWRKNSRAAVGMIPNPPICECVSIWVHNTMKEKRETSVPFLGNKCCVLWTLDRLLMQLKF